MLSECLWGAGSAPRIRQGLALVSKMPLDAGSLASKRTSAISPIACIRSGKVMAGVFGMFPAV